MRIGAPIEREGAARTPTRWESAYQQFETPEQERRKFVKRLKSVGADLWPLDSRVLEVCSGRGSGLYAWRSLGFRRVVGVDYSESLVRAQRSPMTVVGDARRIPLVSQSIDIAVVQGGLHHLLTIEDVNQALEEMCRVTGATGVIVIIEPWVTPFLRFVHGVCNASLARRVSRKIDALATMIEEERDTYDRWLNAPDEHWAVIRRHVVPRLVRRRWGKLVVVGSPNTRNRAGGTRSDTGLSRSISSGAVEGL
jgi:ubiquinone/menaquinone biosynthesis C-methylase UbiE